jgi:osmotically-inducible protein OsmY
MQDKVLKRLVEDELEWEPSVDATGIGVSVETGIVNLSGHVASYAELLAAERAVKRIKGVRGFLPELEVRLAPDADSDQAIAARIANILDWDVWVPNHAITVQVHDGRVTLSGEVEWAYQRMAAENGLRHLAGVRSFSNAIVVKPHIHPGDIKRRIVAALDRRADSAAEHVQVSVEGGRVMLDGRVPTWAERETVEHAAWAAPGVTAVEDRTTIGA